MKSRFPLVAVALLLLVVPISTMGYPPPEGPNHMIPYVDPNDLPEGCHPPNGYTWACGYYASTANGECACREGDTETTMCMKSNAGTGCGIFESPNDECCQSSSGF